MPEDRFARTRTLIGDPGLEKLNNATVMVFGLGGVGGICAEALARAGVGTLHIVDNDVVDITNLNRQIVAVQDTVGRRKTDVMEERILSIGPEITVVKHDIFYLPENADEIDFSGLDYVVDAVDTVTAKLQIASKAKAAGVPVISCMGTGNRMDPSKLVITDISRTHTCGLAKAMRRGVRSWDIGELKVLFSEEVPVKADPPGSNPFVPPAAGLMIAGEVVREIIGKGG
ncbi:MAG: tRNA threonylcarbamoyladenosine dehydratase [Anaerovoracaceae bacterium]|nr:tRNA threonylcarbamoyladenosine dehydratase [Anaerovoracaceae bacterium]